jgi:acetate---CoA ligase (ADP-forming) subunit beta
MQVIDQALAQNRLALSEYESKQILAHYDIPIAHEKLVANEQEVVAAIEEFEFPLVIKGCSPEISHKTEKNLIFLDLRSQDDCLRAVAEIRKNMGPAGGFLIQEMVKGKRELMVGMTRDPQFGPCVMFGLGGIFTEVLKDVVFRMAPITKKDAFDMMGEIRSAKILGPVRGMPEVNKDSLSQILINVGKIGLENEQIQEIDINPLIARGSECLAVDALMVLR